FRVLVTGCWTAFFSRSRTPSSFNLLSPTSSDHNVTSQRARAPLLLARMDSTIDCYESLADISHREMIRRNQASTMEFHVPGWILHIRPKRRSEGG
ncbi:unnamed protein product, partial [Cyprideis torosa]